MHMRDICGVARFCSSLENKWIGDIHALQVFK